jgi:hypothetical protein
MVEWLNLSKRKEKAMTISEKLLDELLKDYKNPVDLLGKNGIEKTAY